MAAFIIRNKVRKFSRRGKLQRIEDIEDPEVHEKRELVKILMSKCNKTQEDILEEYDIFYQQHPEGQMSKDEYVNSTKVSLKS